MLNNTYSVTTLHQCVSSVSDRLLLTAMDYKPFNMLLYKLFKPPQQSLIKTGLFTRVNCRM